MDSCAAAHLTTVVLRRLVLRMVHCVGGLNLVSDALCAPGVYSGRGGWLDRALSGSQIVSFDLKLRDSKHSKRKSRADFRLLPVGFTHTQPNRVS